MILDERIKTLIAALLGAAVTFQRDIPLDLQRVLLAVGGLVILDIISGLAVAITERKLSSHTARNRTFIKALQYSVVMGLGMVVSLLTQSHLWIAAAGYGLCGVEFLSILENLAKLEAHGTKLGPVRPFLSRISGFFTAAQEIQQAKADQAAGLITMAPDPTPAPVHDSKEVL
jgi:phage-related holin